MSDIKSWNVLRRDFESLYDYVKKWNPTLLRNWHKKEEEE